MAMLRIGLIGAGRHGERYLRHLRNGDVAGATISAFWRRDAGKGAAAAREKDVRFEPELDRLIASPDVDALIAAVPAGEHEDVALRVARAKKPLLLEKPIARTVAEARNIIAAFDRSAVPLMIAQTLRFDPLVVMLRRLLLTEGPLRGFSFEQRLEPRGLVWEDDPLLSGGGVLIQTAIHTIDALRFITGHRPIEVISAASASIEYLHNEDHAVLLLRAEEALGTVAASKLGRARTVRFALYLASCTLEADLISRTLTKTTGVEPRTDPRGRGSPGPREDRAKRTASLERATTPVPEAPTVVAAVSAFTELVAGKRDNPVPGADAASSLAVVEAAYRVAQLTGGSSTNPRSRTL